MDTRKALIQNVRDFATRQGSRNSWDKVAALTDEQILEVLGPKCNSAEVARERVSRHVRGIPLTGNIVKATPVQQLLDGAAVAFALPPTVTGEPIKDSLTKAVETARAAKIREREREKAKLDARDAQQKTNLANWDAQMKTARERMLAFLAHGTVTLVVPPEMNAFTPQIGVDLDQLTDGIVSLYIGWDFVPKGVKVGDKGTVTYVEVNGTLERTFVLDAQAS